MRVSSSCGCYDLESLQIMYEYLHSYLTHIYQPLDVAVNGTAKQFMKRKFIDWYAKQIVNTIDDGTAVENIDIKMKLSVMNPLHASWIIDLYNYMTSSAGREVCINVWKRSLTTNKYITQYESNSDSEWEDEDGNVFDLLNNENVSEENE